MPNLPRVSAFDGIVAFCYVVIGLGVVNLLADRYEGHPLADAWKGMFK